MLIPSKRLRAGDLEAWQTAERADTVHAQLAAFQRRIEPAIKAIVDFASSCRCYAGVSWGKDSTVLAHLIWRAREYGVDVPLVWVRVEPITNPDCVIVRDAFLSRWPVRYEEIEIWCRRDDAGWHARGTLERGFAEAARRHGDCHISGVRGAESGARKARMRHWGIASPHTCAPIGWWSSEDVFAYLHIEGLPVHPAYAMSMRGMLPRNRIRVASISGQRGTGFGRAEWEQTYYRDVWSRAAGIG